MSIIFNTIILNTKNRVIVGVFLKTAIKTKDLHRTFYLDDVPVHVLKGINLQINKGEFVSIMGPSGSGKSTVMHIMGCLDRPSSGTLHVGDENTSDLNDDQLAFIRGKKIGFVFQFFFLIPSLSVLKNVMMPMILTGSGNNRKEKAEKMLGFVGLKKRKDFMPSQLSGGERQRVAIARALVNDPEILLVDEPTGNLDSKTGKDIMDLLGQLNKKKDVTLVVITHDPKVAARATRHIYIQDGKIIKDSKK